MLLFGLLKLPNHWLAILKSAALLCCVAALQTMRLPATDRQLFISRHMSPYAPSYYVHSSSTALLYRQAADHLLQALLTGNFNRSTAQPSKAAAAAAATAAATAAAAGGVQQGSAGDSVGWDEVLPARKALMDDLDLQFEAGLRPKHTWLVIRGNQLLLDLMSGSYLWLKPVHSAAAAGDGAAAAVYGEAAAAGVAVDGQGAAAAAAAAAAAVSTLPPLCLPAAPRHRRRPRKSSSSSSSSGVGGSSSSNASWQVEEDIDSADSNSSSSSRSSYGEHEGDNGDLLLALDSRASAAAAAAASQPAAAARKRLDTSALYDLLLELPDGSMHVITTPLTATGLLAAYSTSQSATAAPIASSSSSSSAKPLPLAAALVRAQRVAAVLVSQQQAFLSREAAVRLAGMVGGWKVPSKASEQQPAMPASEYCSGSDAFAGVVMFVVPDGVADALLCI
jgi:hypothetical protein